MEAKRYCIKQIAGIITIKSTNGPKLIVIRQSLWKIPAAGLTKWVQAGAIKIVNGLNPQRYRYIKLV